MDEQEINLTKSQIYYRNHKEILKSRAKDYYHSNREVIKDRVKGYYQNNREECLARVKNYRAENFYEWDKRQKIAIWKRRGVKHPNMSELYDFYFSCEICELCGCELTGGLSANGKCLDHLHDESLEDNFRNVICRKCNNTRDGERKRNKKGQYIPQ
ncbi:MAG: hypothetical protein ACR2M6_00555 [Vampirovibrionia bacterium]